MIDIRIVCTHDAVKTAETLRRLLEAEMHAVEISFGRHSMDHFESAENGREIVLLIWSNNAPGAYYMLDWATRFNGRRLIEIAMARGWPEMPRAAPVLDFSQWHGERGGGAWRALNDRLRSLGRTTAAPRAAPPPPKQAAMAMGLLSTAAVVGALVVRLHEGAGLPAPQPQPQPEQDVALHVSASEGIGGPLEQSPLEAVEPPSADDVTFIVRPRVAPLAPLRPIDTELAEVPSIKHFTLRPPTLLERLEDLNPFRRSEGG